MKKGNLLLVILISVISLLLLTQCTEKYPGATKELTLATGNGCVDCHLDAEKLKKVATPLPPVEGDAGEG